MKIHILKLYVFSHKNAMARATIYTKSYCPYCHKVKATMEMLKIDYTEIDVTQDEELQQEMIARSGQRTVPQVFLHVGGSDDFHELLRKGSLDFFVDGEKDADGESCSSGVCSI